MRKLGGGTLPQDKLGNMRTRHNPPMPEGREVHVSADDDARLLEQVKNGEGFRFRSAPAAHRREKEARMQKVREMGVA